MYCKVKVLRHRGARRHQHDIAADAGSDGDLTLARVGAAIELKLAAADDSQQKPILPILYEAQLVTMQGNKMLFTGLQRDNGAGYEQEWSVMVLGA